MPIASSTTLSQPDALRDLETVIDDATRQRLLVRAAPWRPVVGGGGQKIARLGALPGRRRMLAIRSVCKMVRTLVGEMLMLTGEAGASGRDRRFALAHVQQISMYVCHVVLQLTMTEIGLAVGRDRTTVGHACARVEDRRDNHAYDQLIAAVERVVGHIFGPAGTRHP